MSSAHDPAAPTRADRPPAGRPHGGAPAQWRRRFEAELDRRYVDRVTGTYLVVASAWILLSGPAATWFARVTSLPQGGLEVAKGLLFVLVTGLALRTALRRWAGRVEIAAAREHVAAEQLRQAQELRSAFLNGVSHQLRTPLTSIIGYGEILQRLCREDAAEDREELANRLVVNAERLRGLVLDLLDTDALLRGIGHLQIRRVDVGALITAVTSDHALGGRRLLLEGGSVEADVDPPKLERVVQLLLDNAVKHTPASAELIIRWSERGDHVQIVVEDDGPGLPDDILATIFQPFVQGRAATASANPGIGIGLTLVEQYVRLHHGTARAENLAPGGTRICLEFPSRQPEAAPALADAVSVRW